jgi:hypothetical protein
VAKESDQKNGTVETTKPSMTSRIVPIFLVTILAGGGGTQLSVQVVRMFQLFLLNLEMKLHLMKKRKGLSQRRRLSAL